MKVSKPTWNHSAFNRLIAGLFMAAGVGLMNPAAASTRELKRPDLIFRTETRVPKIAGVPPLIAPPAGSPTVYFRKLTFKGERQYAHGPYTPDNSYATQILQRRQVLGGEILHRYDPATDTIVVSNTGLVQWGEVSTPPPWDLHTGPFGVLPVLTVEVPLTSVSGISASSGNNPMGLRVTNAILAADDGVFKFWSNTQALFGLYSAIEWRDDFSMELSEEDTPEQAEARARLTRVDNQLNPNERHTIRQTIANGNAWTIREVSVTYFHSGACPGLYEMVRKLERRAVGTQAWAFYREEREALRAEHGDLRGQFALPLEPGYEVRLVDLTLEHKAGGCSSGGCSGDLAGLGVGPTVGSIKWDLPLGLGSDGRVAGVLSLFAENISPLIYTPAALTCVTLGADAEVIRSETNAIRQILVPQAFVDVVSTGADAFEVRFYDRSQVGALGTDGLFSPTGTSYVTWRVDDPGGGRRWRMTRIIGTDREETLVDESQPGLRVFSEAGGARITETTMTTEGSDRVEAIVVKDSTGKVSSKRKVYYRTFLRGEEKVKEVLDPEGAALTTTWGYSTANNQTNQKLLSITHPDGFIEQMQYSNETGVRLQHTYAGFRSTRKTDSDRIVADYNGDGVLDYLWWERDGFALSNLGARFVMDWGGVTSINGTDYTVRESKQAVAAGAAWNTAGNITTLERYVAAGPHAGRLAYRRNPDGTLLTHHYETNPDGTTTTIEEQGAPDGAGENVADGTRTVRILSNRGFPVTTVTTDIATGLVLASETVGQSDAFGRPTEILHLDGSIEDRNYCLSCGSMVLRAHRGETVESEYDSLRRKVREIRRADQTILTKLRFEYDADGRLTKTWRVDPEDDTETVESETEYDLAGRVVVERTRGAAATTYGYHFGGGNSTVTTTTFADGGTRIETRDNSGALLRLEGTTVAPVEYHWGAREWWGGGAGYLLRERQFQDETNFITIESSINFLGEVESVTLADGARSYRYFDNLGRMIREVDPDGVTALYAYDSHGRLAVSAVDMNGNNTIDFGGADRITRTLNEVGLREGHTVQRNTTQVWEVTGQDTPIEIAVSEQSVDGLQSWQTERGQTTVSVTTFDGEGGRTVTTTAPDGIEFVQVFLGDRLVSATTGHPELGTLASVTYDYNSLGQLTGSTDARTGTTSYSYDTEGRLQTITTPDPDPDRSGDGYDPQVTTNSYDNMGRTTAITHPDGGIVHTTYFVHGQPKRIWGSRTYPVEYSYDYRLRLKTLTTWQDFGADAGRAVTTWNYNPNRGWKDNKRYHDNTGPTYSYRSSGRLFRRTWARGVQTTYGYNAAGDLANVDYSDSTPDVAVTYDRVGRPKTYTDGAGSRQLAYDPVTGRQADEDYAVGLLAGFGVHRTFDSQGRLESVSALAGSTLMNRIDYRYDPASRLDTVAQGGNTATYAYLANSPLVGGITHKQDGTTRLTTTKAYDHLNRLAGIANTPASTSTSNFNYTYNSANQRTQLTREDNVRWDYSYDELGQVTSAVKESPGGATVPGFEHAWSFDDIGNRKSATVNEAVSTYSANLLNQYSARTVPGRIDLLAAAQPGVTVTYQYPAETGTPALLTRTGDPLYAQLPADNSTANLYGSVKFTGVKNHAGPNGEDAVTAITRDVYLPKTPETFVYDADGNLTADGKWRYAWDAENRLTKLDLPNALIQAGLPRRIVEFAYDGQGRRVSKKVTDSVRAGTSAMQAAFFNNTDLSGTPILVEEWWTLHANWGGSPGPGVLSDNFSVRWTGRIAAPATGTWNIGAVWNQNDDVRIWIGGQLLVDQWSGPGSSGSGVVNMDAGVEYPLVLEFRNWGGGAQVQLRWSGPGVSDTAVPSMVNSNYPGQTTVRTNRYVYDGWNLLAEVDDAGAAKRTYAWGLDLSGTLQGAGGVGGLLFANSLSSASNSAAYAASFDGNGNVVGYVDMATGAKSASYEYSAFGETLVADGPTHEALPFRFSTKYQDPEIGFYNFGYRIFQPSTGRWLSRDPYEEDGGANLYGFVENAPTEWIDPLGLALYAFDGTNNDGYRDEQYGHETNVFILWKIYFGLKAYEAGVGTNNGLLNPIGLAFGYGGKARGRRMLGKATEFIQSGDNVADILGYSRGAAQARDFANKLKETFPCAFIRWIGLFDTVASEGLPNDINIGYKLGIPKDTGSVLHLVAGAERRKRTFALSSILTGSGLPGANPNYIEELMPNAVHSDVGGYHGKNRGLANQALYRMWSHGRSNGVPFGPIDSKYNNLEPNGPNESLWFNDKIVERLTNKKRIRKVYYHP